MGWIHKRNKLFLEVLKKSGDYINSNEIKKISQDKKLLKKFLKKKVVLELCPVFEQSSFNPKKKFNPEKKFGQKKLFNVERSFLSPLGLPQYGVHCNGWSKEKSDFFFHFALRSKKLRDFPNHFDNIFAGGQPTGISISENLKKEASEEAGLKILKKNLIVGNVINYSHNHNDEIHSGVIFVYDYQVNKNVKLINNDGEVKGFKSIEVDKIYKILERKLLKPNCIIPIADFFLRNMRDFFPNSGILRLEELFKENGQLIK